MAVDSGFVAFIVDQLNAGMLPVEQKKMFGGVGLYSEGVFFAMIWDDKLMLRLDEAGEQDYLAAGFVAYDPDSAGRNRKRYYEVPVDVYESHQKFAEWATKSIGCAQLD